MGQAISIDGDGLDMQGRAQSATAAITAQNTFTTAKKLRGRFNIAIWGTFAGTVFHQKSFDAGVTWLDVESWTAPVAVIREEPEGNVSHRIGIKTGGFTSGTCNVRISQ